MKTMMITITLIILALSGCGHQEVPRAGRQSRHLSYEDKTTSQAPSLPSPGLAFASSDASGLSRVAEQKAFIDWILGIHGELSGSHPLAPKAERIFERVLRAADKRTGRVPKLLMIQDADDPWAMCLENGTVILTQKGLEFCYQDVGEAAGNTRLAFIIGHELAHLSKDDFWEYKAFEMVKKFGSGARGIQEILGMLSGSEDTRDPAYVRERIKEKEIRADQYGLLYAAMAGYNPKSIVDEANGENFFREWVDQITGKIAYTDDEHPEPEQRAAFLLAYMNAVNTDLILFDFGVRLYQIGMFEDSLSFLNAFQEKFPCREVSNNIGLVRYELAMKALSRFNQEAAYRYKLPTVLDTETRARIFRGDPEAAFNREIRSAITNFEYACNQDRFYIPARVNLSSALIIKGIVRPDETGNFYEAMRLLKDASKLTHGDPKILNNQALVMYLLGPEFGADNSEKAADILKDVISEHPGFSDPYYNLARILDARGQDSAAEDAWERFLNLEPLGVYADMATSASGIAKSDVRKNAVRRFSDRPPLEPGPFDRKAEAYLEEVPKQSFDLENLRGEYYTGDNFCLLVLEDEIELVETSPARPITYDDLVSEYGDPKRVFTDVSGKKVLVYERFAADILDGVVIKVAHFEKQEI